MKYEGLNIRVTGDLIYNNAAGGRDLVNMLEQRIWWFG